MRVVVIGGTGHIGTYLVPRLAALDFEIVSVSRQQRAPYQSHGAWKRVRQVTLDRAASEAAGKFGAQVAALEPDIVVDPTCFSPESNRQLVGALRGKVQHFLHCGTI